MWVPTSKKKPRVRLILVVIFIWGIVIKCDEYWTANFIPFFPRAKNDARASSWHIVDCVNAKILHAYHFENRIIAGISNLSLYFLYIYKN